jgi:hypothetical protein
MSGLRQFYAAMEQLRRSQTAPQEERAHSQHLQLPG